MVWPGKYFYIECSYVLSLLLTLHTLLQLALAPMTMTSTLPLWGSSSCEVLGVRQPSALVTQDSHGRFRHSGKLRRGKRNLRI